MEGPQSKSREFDQFRLISSDFIADCAVGLIPIPLRQVRE